MTLEDYLRQNAECYPEKVAVVCREQQITYRGLYDAVCKRAERLPRGEVIPFRSSQTIDFLVEYFAIHQAGSVAAPLERDTPESLLRQIGDSLREGSLPDNAADILYTTGTTGRSKGVIVSHQAIMADAENLIEGQGFSHDLVFVVNGPLNHIGSLSKIWPVVMTGATLYILEGMKDLNAFFKALDYPAQKMATFFVPATIRMLLMFDGNRLGSYADKLDFIESGAAPLPHADMLRLCELLPKTRLYNTYASTETGIIATYNYNLQSASTVPSSGAVCGPAGCLGRPMNHSRIVITDEGLIACKGDTLMSGYVNDPELTATVLRDHIIYTSDIGYLDDEGMLRLTGRQNDTINVGGFKVAPSEVEAAAMSQPEVSDCVCIAVNHPITGCALKLLVVTAESVTFDKRQLARSLSGLLETYKVPMFYEQVERVQRTYNGKLDRKYYQELNKK